MKFWLAFFASALVLLSVPGCEASAIPNAKLYDGSVITGRKSSSTIETFFGVPFALPPVGSLRFRPPLPYNLSLNGLAATERGPACITENIIDFSFTDVPENVTDILDDIPFLQGVDPGLTFNEDCLTLDIYRPAGTTASSNLPVLFWIFGGGFQFGSTASYDASHIVNHSIKMGKPVVVVVINYRLGAYGWLGGSEVVSAGPGNWGLLDQRLALEWVADNIAGFGGNPSMVTIFGESAGAISVGHQMLLYDGNNTYKGKPLFVGAIMESGSIVPTKKLDSAYPQQMFDQVAAAAGCSNAPSPLECLRAVDVDTLNAAQNTLPGIFSNKSIGLSFLPRWDGWVLSDQVYNLVADGKYAKVPFIIGDQEDEGTLFAMPLDFIDSTPKVNAWIKELLPDMTTAEELAMDVLYPDRASSGSPFNTGIFNELYPQYKRMAAMLGDMTFEWPRRYFLQKVDTPSWSFMSNALYGTPFLGTLHATDLAFLWHLPDIFVPSKAYRSYWISFAYAQNPNTYSGLINWPQYSASRENLVIGLLELSTGADNYRQLASDYINSHISDLLF